MTNPEYDYALQLVAAQRTQRYIREAEIDHLLSELHSDEPSWWSRQTRQLSRWAHGLASIGERIQAPNKAGARSIREQPVG